MKKRHCGGLWNLGLVLGQGQALVIGIRPEGEGAVMRVKAALVGINFQTELPEPVHGWEAQGGPSHNKWFRR